jgi:hypothetical protein
VEEARAGEGCERRKRKREGCERRKREQEGCERRKRKQRQNGWKGRSAQRRRVFDRERSVHHLVCQEHQHQHH